MTMFAGYTGEELLRIIAEHEVTKPLRGTKAWERMLTAAMLEVAHTEKAQLDHRIASLENQLAKCA